MYSQAQIEDALWLFKDVDMLDLGDFPEDQRQYIGSQFKILVDTGAARGILANKVDFPYLVISMVLGKGGGVNYSGKNKLNTSLNLGTFEMSG